LSLAKIFFANLYRQSQILHFLLIGWAGEGNRLPRDGEQRLAKPEEATKREGAVTDLARVALKDNFRQFTNGLFPLSGP
jgi:hypothetical protein